MLPPRRRRLRRYRRRPPRRNLWWCRSSPARLPVVTVSSETGEPLLCSDRFDRGLAVNYNRKLAAPDCPAAAVESDPDRKSEERSLRMATKSFMAKTGSIEG